MYPGGQDLSFASNAENLRMLDNKSFCTVTQCLWLSWLSDCLVLPVKVKLAVGEIILAVGEIILAVGEIILVKT